METLFALCAVHLVAMISPGPDFLLVVRNSVRYSHSTGRWTGVGICLGICVHLAYCVVGIGYIISQSILVFNLLKYLGAAYLICIGIMSFMASDETMDLSGAKEVKSISEAEAIKMGFYMNVLNPKAALYFVSVFSALITPETPSHIQWYYVIFAVGSAYVWWWIVSSIFSLAKVQAAFQKARSKVDRTIGVIFVSLGLRVVDV